MFNHPKIALIITFGIFGFVGLAQAQPSFTVTNRTLSSPGSIQLDTTLTATFTVSGQNTTGQTIIPELVIVTTNGAPLDSLNITSAETSAITNWTSGTSRNITFYIHAYNEPQLCGKNVLFQLNMNTSSGVFSAQDNQANLRISTSSSDAINLHTVVAELFLNPPKPLRTTGAFANNFSMEFFDVSSSEVNDPNNRIYLVLDWKTGYLPQTTTPQDPKFAFGFFNLPLAPLGDSRLCLVDLNRRDGNNQLVGLFARPDLYWSQDDIDFDPTDTLFNDPGNPDLPYNPNDLTFGEGINVFDITDLEVPLISGCATSIRNSLAIPIVGDENQRLSNISTAWGGNEIDDIRIYLGSTEICSPNVVNFNTPPSGTQFQIRDIVLFESGRVEASVVVPSAWQSANLRYDWFLRSDDQLIALATNQTASSINTNAGVTIDNPSDYFLEVRVRRDNTSQADAWVSTTSEGLSHRFEYGWLNASTLIIGNESNQDDFLDPGETLRLSFSITDTQTTFSGLTLSSGIIIDANNNGAIDTTDPVITPTTQSQGGFSPNPSATNLDPSEPAFAQSFSSSLRQYNVDYELLTNGGNQDVWLFLEGRTTTSGASYTYRSIVSLLDEIPQVGGLGLDDVQETTSYNFNQGDGTWASGVINGVRGGAGWLFQGTSWFGQGGTGAAEFDDLHTLSSPDLPVGRSVVVTFNHTPQFTLNQSGGLLEYRVYRNGNPITSWRNFITDACPTCDVYDDIAFPNNIDSYLSDERVWMGQDKTNRTEIITATSNFFSGFIEGTDVVVFRFAFQDPSLNPTAPNRSDGPTDWEIFDFNYSVATVVDDNLLGLDLTSLTYNGCGRLFQLVFDEGSATGLDFEWFESLSDLYNDRNGIVGTTTVPFTVNSTDESYYVRITGGLAERIYRVRITNGVDCQTVCVEPFEAISRVLRDAGDWPNNTDVRNFVSEINRICPEEM